MTTQHYQSLSKKRLLSAHPKPKTSASPGSGPVIVPPDDRLLFPQKKTRDLPNLSDCHGCGLHVNHTNPKDRLQTLDSVWRIVLLCRKCIKRVELGQTCPYCYKESANSECFKCRDCERLVHKVCVSKHENSSPWSLSKSEKQLGLGSEFSVCVDCWVPNMFRKSIRIRRRKKNSKNSQLTQKSGDMTTKDPNFTERREVVLALRAPRKLLMNNPDGKKIEGDKAVGDEELAFQLHRAMNRSSRLSKNSKLGVSKSGNVKGSNVEVGKLTNEIITYQRKPKKELKTYTRGCLKRKRFLEMGGSDSSLAVPENCSDENLKTYKRGCLKRKIFLETGGLDSSVEISENENSLTDNIIIESNSCAQLKCDTDDTKESEIINETTDRFMLKYCKRMKRCNSIIVYEPPRNYQICTPQVPMNCSIESKTLSDASLNASVGDLQGYVCVTGLSGEEP